MAEIEKVGDKDSCEQLYYNHKRKLVELLERTEITGKEHWFLLLGTGRKKIETKIYSGEAYSIKTENIRQKVKGHTGFGVVSIWLVHSHPSSGALSPSDIWSHYNSSKEHDKYEGTFEAHKIEGDIEISGVTNKKDVSRIDEDRLETKLDDYQEEIESHYKNDERELVGKTFWELFKYAENHFNICTMSE